MRGLKDDDKGEDCQKVIETYQGLLAYRAVYFD